MQFEISKYSKNDISREGNSNKVKAISDSLPNDNKKRIINGREILR